MHGHNKTRPERIKGRGKRSNFVLAKTKIKMTRFDFDLFLPRSSNKIKKNRAH
jgi:hypothetical protein